MKALNYGVIKEQDLNLSKTDKNVNNLPSNDVYVGLHVTLKFLSTKQLENCILKKSPCSSNHDDDDDDDGGRSGGGNPVQVQKLVKMLGKATRFADIEVKNADFSKSMTEKSKICVNLKRIKIFTESKSDLVQIRGQNWRTELIWHGQPMTTAEAPVINASLNPDSNNKAFKLKDLSLSLLWSTQKMEVLLWHFKATQLPATFLDDFR